MTAIEDGNCRSTQSAMDQNNLKLVTNPERFENVDVPACPPSKPRPPDIERAEVTHYAYDPQTYEILCRPGQRLNQKKAQRLQELNIYAHVVTVAK